jgi:hypothetical protein
MRAYFQIARQEVVAISIDFNTWQRRIERSPGYNSFRPRRIPLRAKGVFGSRLKNSKEWSTFGSVLRRCAATVPARSAHAFLAHPTRFERVTFAFRALLVTPLAVAASKKPIFFIFYQFLIIPPIYWGAFTNVGLVLNYSLGSTIGHV